MSIRSGPRRQVEEEFGQEQIDFIGHGYLIYECDGIEYIPSFNLV